MGVLTMQYRERRRTLAMSRAARAANADKDGFKQFTSREEFLAGLR